MSRIVRVGLTELHPRIAELAAVDVHLVGLREKEVRVREHARTDTLIDGLAVHDIGAVEAGYVHVAAARVVELDLLGVRDVRMTPSVPSR